MSDIDIANTMNPFPGLRPFREGDKHLFFGRERQFQTMVKKLESTHFLAVVGSSGSGKSSLVSCGLQPALHRGLMSSAGTTWRIATCRPGDNPMGALATALAAPGLLYPESKGGIPLEEIIDTYLHMNKGGLLEVYKKAPVESDVNLLLIVDQFEELFRYWNLGEEEKEDKYKEEAISFVNLLLEVPKQTTLPVYVAITIRSDFLGDCTRFPGLAEAINEGQFLVPRMNRTERSEAISGPVGVGRVELSEEIFSGRSQGGDGYAGGDGYGTEALGGHGPVGEEWGQISPVLLTRLVNDVGDQPDQLSILQHALNRTWQWWRYEGQASGPLSVWHYESIGTMDRALDLHADQAFDELGTDRKKKICEKIFRALTDAGTDARGIRRPTRLGTLCKLANASLEEVKEVIDVFRHPSRSFLMPPHQEVLKESTVVDISHESLMRVWVRLKNWVQEEAGHSRIYRRMAETAALYKEGIAKEWRDPDLKHALEWMEQEVPSEAWAEQYGGGLEDVKVFLEKSVALRKKELLAQTRAERIRRRLTIGVAAFAVIALAFGALSWVSSINANKAKDAAVAATKVAEEKAEEARQATIEAEEQRLEANAQRSEAVRRQEEADSLREEAVRQQNIAFEQAAEAEIARQNAQVALESAQYSSQVADEQRINANVNLVGLFEERAERILFENQDQEYHYAWMNTLYALIQDVGDEQLPYSLGRLLLPEIQPGESSPSDGYWEIEMDPKGEKLTYMNPNAEGKMQGLLVRSFSSMESEKEKNNPEACPWGSFNCIEWSRITVWQLDEGSEEVQVSKSVTVPRITAASFSPDGNKLVIAHTVMKWDSTESLIPLSGKIGTWDVDNLKLVKDEAEYPSENIIRSLAFNQQGGFFASGDDKGTVTVWNSQNVDDTITPLFSDSTNAAIRSIQMSPGGRYVAVVNVNNDIVLWDGSQSQSTRRYLNSEDGLNIHTVVFSDNDSLLAMGNVKGVKIWDLTTLDDTLSNRPAIFNQPGEVYSLDFSENAEYLAIGNRRGTLRVMDMENRSFSHELDTSYVIPGNSILGLAFSPDGERIASAHQDGIMTLWSIDKDSAAHVLTTEAILRGHQDRLLYLNFIDKNKLESVAEDGTIRNITMEVNLFDQQYNLDTILSDDSTSNKVLEEIFNNSLDYLGLKLEGREFVSNYAVDTGDIMDYYGSSMRAFSLPGGRFLPPVDTMPSIWVQAFDEPGKATVKWAWEKENPDPQFVYLSNDSLSARIRIPAPFSGEKYAELQLGNSDTWSMLYPVYEPVSLVERQKVYMGSTNSDRYFSQQKHGWALHEKDGRETLFIESDRDNHWIYLERGKRSRKFLGITIQQNTMQAYRLPLLGGKLQKKTGDVWADIDVLSPNGDSLGVLLSSHRTLEFPSSSFQQLYESPRSWAHVFESDALEYGYPQNDWHVYEYYYEEVQDRDDSIYLKEDRNSDYMVRLLRNGGKASYSFGDTQNTLYNLFSWYQIHTDTLNYDGRKVTYSNVTLNERDRALKVFPGETVELSFDWRVTVDDSGSCPGCFIQFYLGIEDNFSHCFLSDEIPPKFYKGRSGKALREFTAPQAPGIYYITQNESTAYACDEDPTAHENSPGEALGVIWVVQRPESRRTE